VLQEGRSAATLGSCFVWCKTPQTYINSFKQVDDPPIVCEYDLRNSLVALVDDAIEAGFPSDRRNDLQHLVLEYKDEWRTSLIQDAPADVEPLQVLLQPHAVSYCAKACNYSPDQIAIMDKYITQLLDAGCIRPNSHARWACAAHPVCKPGTDEYRITWQHAKPTSYSTKAQGAVAFATFDLFKGFWQMPLHAESQEYFSFSTPNGVFTLTRVPQGAKDSAIHFQNQMVAALGDLVDDAVLVWIDDCVLFSRDIDSFLQNLKAFFIIMRNRNLKLSVSKNAQGVHHCPNHISALTSLPPPPTAAALQHFLCASNWLRDSIIDYARLVDPLHRLLADCTKLRGRRKHLLEGIRVSWSDSNLSVFHEIIRAIQNSAKSHYPIESATLCIFTDASDIGWGVIITQVRDGAADTAVDQQQHELIVCKSGTFKHAQVNWSIVEKEAFPIVKTCVDMEYLLARLNGFNVYCDHKNLIRIFAPTKGVPKHIRGKLQRWAAILTPFNFTIHHIDGSSNLWADMLSRWHSNWSDPSQLLQCNFKAIRTNPSHVLRPLEDDSFVWPSTTDIQSSQHQFLETRPSVSVVHEDTVLVGGLVWTPEHDGNLITRILVISHCGLHGHRGKSTMITSIQSHFYIDRLNEKVDVFLNQCLLCKHVRGGKQIQRPWRKEYMAKRRNECLHWDFLYMGESFGNEKYLLVVKDELSHYCELIPCATPTTFVAATALLDWYKRFGAADVWQSDRGSHFVNKVLKELEPRLKFKQLITPVYAPWLNGTIERLNRDILTVMRTLLLEFKLNSHEWVHLVPLVQSNLNHSPMQSLNGSAPIEEFTGLPRPSVLKSIVLPGRNNEDHQILSIDDFPRKIEELRRSLSQMNLDIVNIKEKRRLDFVLWARIDERLPSNRLYVQWVGPFQVVDTREYSFIIRHLISNKEFEVHGSRLKFYHDASLETNEELI
ncbi:hypothetical protein AeNC1_013379, partial [Aphanomyces euteiches]